MATNERIHWILRSIGIREEKIAALASELDTDMDALDEAARLLSEARRGHRRIAFHESVPKEKQEAALAFLPRLLEASSWRLVKATRAGEEFLVDRDASEFPRWAPFLNR